MTHLSGSVHGEVWFVALPDHAATLAVSQSPAMSNTRRIDYASGRPWLLGQWNDAAVALADTGSVRVALIGHCSMTSAELTEATRPLHSVRALDRLLPRLSGSCHLVAADASGLRVQGTITGIRRVFHARAGEVDLAASRADVLARLAGTGIDERRLATRLLVPDGPYPLQGQSLWAGVDAVPEDAYVHISGARRGTVVPWWQPPVPGLSLTKGALRLRDALEAAVTAATRGGGRLSCDLSGGMDSTPLCFLAARRADHLSAFTFSTIDPTDDDPYSVKTALAALPELEWISISDDEAPMPFDGVSAPGTAMDEPFLGLEDRSANLEVARRLSGRSRMHLTGHGGDEVFECPPNYLHDLVRTRPRLAWNHLRGHRYAYRWPLRDALIALADRKNYAQWFADTMSHVTQPQPQPSAAQDLAWGLSSCLPPWATQRAADAVLSLATESDGEPLADRRGEHEMLEGIRRSGRDARLLAWLMADNGLPMAAPLLDDRVVEACLAVRPYERTTPWRFKPLITEAMRGIVPQEILRRTTKGGSGADELEYKGLRTHRAELLTLTHDSHLAARGLINPTLLRRMCTSGFLPGLPPAALARTIACEAWLRDVEAADRPSTHSERPT
ncbi:asparagine synthase-related protein [Streptomyces sp. NPDC050315]|uniref:asparagine synthase-related protein n=1 Tax=Streptomyces sp. NPDC050315 TaxID=3155039 RepID=UPI00342D7D45